MSNTDWRQVYREERRRPGYVIENGRTAARRIGRPWLKLETGQPMIVIDHIIPHKGDPAPFWNHDNRRALCRHRHSRETAVSDGRSG